jgi:hypothetical protein
VSTLRGGMGRLHYFLDFLVPGAVQRRLTVHRGAGTIVIGPGSAAHHFMLRSIRATE